MAPTLQTSPPSFACPRLHTEVLSTLQTRFLAQRKMQQVSCLGLHFIPGARGGKLQGAALMVSHLN